MPRVWTWLDWPGRLYAGIRETDLGIDLVAEDELGEFIGIQVKFRLDPRSHLRWEEVSTALGFRPDLFARRLIVTTAADRTANARGATETTPNTGWMMRDDLLASPIDWTRAFSTGTGEAVPVRLVRDVPVDPRWAGVKTVQALAGGWRARSDRVPSERGLPEPTAGVPDQVPSSWSWRWSSSRQRRPAVGPTFQCRSLTATLRPMSSSSSTCSPPPQPRRWPPVATAIHPAAPPKPANVTSLALLRRARAGLGDWSSQLSPEEYPTLARLASDLTDADPESRFRFGLNNLVAELQARTGRGSVDDDGRERE